MSKWGSEVLRIAQQNPDVRVTDDATMPAIPHEYVCGFAEGEKTNKYPLRVATEAEEQEWLFDWIHANRHRHEALQFAHHSPNGEWRHPATAAKLKRMGVNSGFPDVVIFWQRHDVEADRWHAGLAIELKRSDHSNKPTPEQEQWLLWLDSQDWRCVVCYGAQEAIGVIREYLEMEV